MKKTNFDLQPFIPGETYVPVSGKVFDDQEIKNATQAAQDGWWTEGEFARRFENEFKKILGVRYVSLVNSGSSANLNAVAALTSSVWGERQLRRGDEFITTPVGFPTTLNPGLFYGLKPVFIDAKAENLNIDSTLIEKAISKKTKLIMIAHTLGMPFDIQKIAKIAKKHNLWLIEDCCDALGARSRGKLVGTFGDIATFSFYPAHQITMGEGGALITNNSLLHRAIRQFRDWGRDCWCDTGKDNTCGKRFGWKLGDVPFGYDHKYIYSQIGFNFKLTDFQAAIGLAQLKKLPFFIKKRRENYDDFKSFFKSYSRFFSIMKIDKDDNPCWFGFPFLVKPKAPFTRNEFTTYLESKKVGTRNVFSGNLLKHPAYSQIPYRTVGVIKNADIIMNNACWIGVFPGIDAQRRKYIKNVIKEFLDKY